MLFNLICFCLICKTQRKEKARKPLICKAFSWRALGDSNPRPFDS